MSDNPTTRRVGTATVPLITDWNVWSEDTTPTLAELKQMQTPECRRKHPMLYGGKKGTVPWITR